MVGNEIEDSVGVVLRSSSSPSAIPSASNFWPRISPPLLAIAVAEAHAAKKDPSGRPMTVGSNCPHAVVLLMRNSGPQRVGVGMARSREWSVRSNELGRNKITLIMSAVPFRYTPQTEGYPAARNRNPVPKMLLQSNTLKPSTSCRVRPKLRRDPAINRALHLKQAKVLPNQDFTAWLRVSNPG